MASHSFKATKLGWLVAWTFTPKNAPYGIVQRIQIWETWRPNGPGQELCLIYFMQAWVVLCLGPGSVLL